MLTAALYDFAKDRDKSKFHRDSLVWSACK